MARARLGSPSARRRSIPQPIKYPSELPIVARREEIKEAIDTHQVVIVAGETGSGKSTQIPKLCLELGRGVDGMIGHTQPRRIAARSIAERVADELGTGLGDLVGYTVRFTDQVGAGTLIRVMTDGILLNELQRDRKLRSYDTIIIDEAHERSLNIDFLLGYLKRLLPERPDLKVIITSATIDTERFSEHFDGAPVVEVSGRMYPVEMRYRPLAEDEGPKDQVDGIVDAVVELSGEGPGDILVFCSGEREIRDATDALRDLELRHTEVLPLYGRLSAAEQHRVFSGHTGRRIVVATNVAETSITVPGIRYVVDTGSARISRYSRRTKVQRLPIEPISQASANQRAGRCGRLGPGICIRLYSVEDYLSRPEFTDPEILRTNLASVILQMAAIGLGEISDFPFVEPPDTRAIRDGVALLEELQAVAGEDVGSSKWLTPIGRRLARLPVDPRLGRILLAAHEENCVREALTLVAALSIIDPRERPTGKEQHADQMHARFKDASSDFASLLSLWEYVSKQRKELTSSQFRRMCQREFLSWRRIREWQDVRAQLRRVAKQLDLRVNADPAPSEAIHIALLSGLLSHVGAKDPDGFEYRGPRGVRFSISPGSALFKRAPQWIMAAELVETSRTWARVNAPVEPGDIETVGSHLVRRQTSDPWWDAERGAAVAAETVTLLGLTIVQDRVVLAAKHDPEMARRLLIRHALVLGEWQTHFQFAEHNAAMIQDVLDLEARERRSDLLVDEDAVARFFESRIPEDVVSVRHFERWWNQVREDAPTLLNLSEDDLIAAEAQDVDDASYPPEWVVGDLVLDLRYEFDPTSPQDGVTVSIPDAYLERLDPSAFEWNVPGLRTELFGSLIKSLPKRLRKQFVPVPDVAASLSTRLSPSDGSLIEALRAELTRRGSEVVMPGDFDWDRVPTHLRLHFEILDATGQVIAAGDDLGAVREQLLVERAATVAAMAHPIERSGIVEWDFGVLPATVPLGDPDTGAGVAAVGRPALIDEGDSVAIRLVANTDEQVDQTWRGVRRLLVLALPSASRLLDSVLSGQGSLALAASPYAGRAEWAADALTCALDKIMSDYGPLPLAAAEFQALLAATKNDLADVLDDVADVSERILVALSHLGVVYERTTGARYADATKDVADQISQFVYPGFLTGVGYDRLGDVLRYVEAATYRLEKLPDAFERDAAAMTRVRRLEADFEEIVDSIPWRSEILDVTWMLQELRVSLFAQPIGAKGKVSEKRVRQALAELVLPS